MKLKSKTVHNKNAQGARVECYLNHFDDEQLMMIISNRIFTTRACA